MGMLLDAQDMPRTAEGLVPDVMVNPHCIPSRMTIAQLLEQVFGKLGAVVGAKMNATSIMNDEQSFKAIGDALEAVWNSPTYSAVPPLCTASLPPVAVAALCGLYSRFDNATQPAACTTGVTDYGALQPVYQPDTDVVTGQADIYSTYSGNGRRVITVPVVDGLPPNTATPMVVLGFRQFLLQPNPDGTFFNPSDTNGRFVATYIGSPMPVKQGYIDDRFAQSCPAPVTSGPGKVVLHR